MWGKELDTTTPPHRAVIQICELLEAPAEQVQPLAVTHRVLLGPKNKGLGECQVKSPKTPLKYRECVHEGENK